MVNDKMSSKQIIIEALMYQREGLLRDNYYKMTELKNQTRKDCADVILKIKTGVIKIEDTEEQTKEELTKSLSKIGRGVE